MRSQRKNFGRGILTFVNQDGVVTSGLVPIPNVRVIRIKVQYRIFVSVNDIQLGEIGPLS